MLCTSYAFFPVLCFVLYRGGGGGKKDFVHLVIVIALHISTVSKRGDIEDKTLEFSPTFTHQVFGER